MSIKNSPPALEVGCQRLEDKKRHARPRDEILLTVPGAGCRVQGVVILVGSRVSCAPREGERRERERSKRENEREKRLYSPMNMHTAIH